MVSYSQWTKAVSEVYAERARSQGVEPYGSQDVAQAVIRAASRWWNENKEQIIQLAFDAAKKLAEELMNEYIRNRGSFP